MINLLTYTDPSKGFATDEDKVMIKIQIDNALDLGWKREDILLATDFPYEYNGVKSVLVEDKNPITWNLTQGKVIAICDLFSRGLLKDNELYWFHDLDAFQLVPITEEELGLGGLDFGLTNCGRKRMVNGGSIFFNNKTRDVFEWIKKRIYDEHSDEELSLEYLATTGEMNMKNRYKMLDHTYNLGIKDFEESYRGALKPIRVVHFHPMRRHHMALYRDILPERLFKIFNKYGID